mmetsp:Transcript_20910/g.67777  ORF Transcript_20910/g.67777 Transcript_20910/m.67777 type:complete len:212 (+) Transcript_20910:166-801(+)
MRPERSVNRVAVGQPGGAGVERVQQLGRGGARVGRLPRQKKPPAGQNRVEQAQRQVPPVRVAHEEETVDERRGGGGVRGRGGVARHAPLAQHHRGHAASEIADGCCGRHPCCDGPVGGKKVSGGPSPVGPAAADGGVRPLAPSAPAAGSDLVAHVEVGRLQTRLRLPKHGDYLHARVADPGANVGEKHLVIALGPRGVAVAGPGVLEHRLP